MIRQMLLRLKQIGWLRNSIFWRAGRKIYYTKVGPIATLHSLRALFITRYHPFSLFTIQDGPLKKKKLCSATLVPSPFISGRLKPEQDQAICELCKPGMVAFDIGANVGYYTLLLSKLVGSSGKVYAFEPNPETIKILKQTILANDLTNVEIFQMALADKTGTAEFQYDSAGDLDACLVEKGTYVHPPGRVVKSLVPVVTLDDFVADRSISRVDFVKMDTQGADLFVLQGMRRVIGKWQPRIVCEMIGPERLDVADRFLSAVGYGWGQIDEGYTSYPQPVRWVHIAALPKSR